MGLGQLPPQSAAPVVMNVDSLAWLQVVDVGAHLLADTDGIRAAVKARGGL